MSIVGHQSQLAQLTADIKQQQLAQTYLFAGPAAVGKFTSALWFAQQLLGKAVELTNPDVHILDKLWIDTQQDDWDTIALSSNVPQKHRAKKPTAKTDTITIEDIHELQNQLHKSPIGQYRICIIKNVERLNVSAANALLKTIEEPPSKLIFILTTSAADQLLETIVSRCRVLQFGKVAYEALQTLLQTIEPQHQQFVTEIAYGCPGVAVRCQNVDYLKQQQALYTAAETFFTSTDPAKRLESLKPLQQKGEQKKDFTRYLWLQAHKHGVDQQTVKMLTRVTSALASNTSKDVITAYMLQCL